MSRPLRPTLLSLALSGLLIVLTAPSGSTAPAGGGKCRPARTCPDTMPPSVTVVSPEDTAAATDSVSMTGTASDDRALASVRVRVDSGPWQSAAGTSSWVASVVTASLPEGTHTLGAQAVDSSGNASAVVSRSVLVDRTAPAVVIGSPAQDETVARVVTVSGTAADASGIDAVDVSVDGGSWRRASGTTSWSLSWDSSTVTDGTHTIVVRATDRAGATSTASRTVQSRNEVSPDSTPPTVSVSAPASGSTVSGQVSVSGSAADAVGVARVDVKVDSGPWVQATGTTSWSWPWDSASAGAGPHSVTARATDTSGNTSSQTVSVSVAVPTGAPTTQGSWTSPEGVRIEVSSAGPWTISQVYDLLRANARNLDRLGPSLTVRVQDTYASMTQTSAILGNGRYSDFSATITLQGVNSGFAMRPDDILTHEYGHAWSMYGYYIVNNGSWGSYLTARWSTADGSQTLATDSRTGSTYSWTVGEIIADDYRLLFGSPTAVSQRPAHLNAAIPAPKDVPRLADAMLAWWG